MRRLAATFLLSLAACSGAATDEGSSTTSAPSRATTPMSTLAGWVELTPHGGSPE